MAAPKKYHTLRLEGVIGDYIRRDLDQKDYVRRRIARYIPRSKKVHYADLYTELYRFQEGYYAMEVADLRRQLPEKKRKYALTHLTYLSFSSKVMGKDTCARSELLAFELEGASCCKYLATKPADHNTMTDLAWEWGDNTNCLFAGINAGGDGLLVIIKVLPKERDDVFDIVRWYMKTKYEIIVKEAGQHYMDSFPVTHDPNCVVKTWHGVYPFPKDRLFTEYLQAMQPTKLQHEFNQSVRAALVSFDFVRIKHKGIWGYFIPRLKNIRVREPIKPVKKRKKPKVNIKKKRIREKIVGEKKEIKMTKKRQREELLKKLNEWRKED